MSTGTIDLLLTPVLAGVLMALVRADLAERRLPDRLTLPLMVAGLALAGWRAGGWPWAEAVGAAGGFGAFWALGEAHHRLRGREGLGLGDAKLLGAAGAWLGWRPLPALVLVAALGALAGVALTRPRRADVAFGPWLALAFLALWAARLARDGGLPPETFALIDPWLW